LEIDARTMPFDAVIAASGKCIEGPPGMGFVLVRKSVLEQSAGNSLSLSLDLYDQWVYMEKTTQWRFTPPTHIVVAFHEALNQFLAEGGQPARLKRYTENYQTLMAGMAELGLKQFLDPEIQAPIIVTMHAPAHPNYSFKEFYDRVRNKGFILYPGKLTRAETFRVGCIGAIGTAEMRQAINAMRDALVEMGIHENAVAA
jgi:2-aminoethylphosphonate-pyruvate transaminase